MILQMLQIRLSIVENFFDLEQCIVYKKHQLNDHNNIYFTVEKVTTSCM